MKTGLLWQDEITQTRGLRRCIARAVAAYRRKYGAMPDTCAVNAHLEDIPATVGTVRVVGMHNVLLEHYWVGVEEAKSEHKKPPL